MGFASEGYLINSARVPYMFSLKWHRLIGESEVIPGRVQVHKVLGRLVGITNLNGNVYVFDGRCPHAGRSLQDSAVTPGGTVVCSKHGLRLSLYPQTCSDNAMLLTRYAFRICNGYIEIDRQALLRRYRQEI
jgi:nitrite reductase/ring-hydroxylating ferredoxin subunit